MKYDSRVKQEAIEFIEKYGLTPIHKKVIQLIKPNSIVLEVGCAWGYLTKELKNKNCKVVCVEIDEELAEKAKPYCYDIIVGDAENDSVQNQIGKYSYDYIILTDIL